MTAYAPLMESPETQVRVDLLPEDAIKLVTRLRKVAFFLRVSMPLVTERREDGTVMGMDLGNNVEVSAAQAVKILKRQVDINARRVQADKPLGRIEVTRLGECLFIG